MMGFVTGQINGESGLASPRVLPDGFPSWPVAPSEATIEGFPQ